MAENNDKDKRFLIKLPGIRFRRRPNPSINSTVRKEFVAGKMTMVDLNATVNPPCVESYPDFGYGEAAEGYTARPIDFENLVTEDLDTKDKYSLDGVYDELVASVRQNLVGEKWPPNFLEKMKKGHELEQASFKSSKNLLKGNELIVGNDKKITLSLFGHGTSLVFKPVTIDYVTNSDDMLMRVTSKPEAQQLDSAYNMEYARLHKKYSKEAQLPEKTTLLDELPISHRTEPEPAKKRPKKTPIIPDSNAVAFLKSHPLVDEATQGVPVPTFTVEEPPNSPIPVEKISKRSLSKTLDLKYSKQTQLPRKTIFLDELPINNRTKLKPPKKCPRTPVIPDSNAVAFLKSHPLVDEATQGVPVPTFTVEEPPNSPIPVEKTSEPSPSKTLDFAENEESEDEFDIFADGGADELFPKDDFNVTPVRYRRY